MTRVGVTPDRAPMYAALLTAKGGHIAAANAAAAAAAVKDVTDHDQDHDDDDTNAHAGPPPVVTSRGRVGTARGGDELLKEKKLNPDGSFGDPLPKVGSSPNLPQPWVCPRPDCGRNNFQWRKTCPHCGTKRPDPSQAPANVTKGEDAPAFKKPPVAKHDQDREERSRPAAAAKKPAPPPAEVARGDKANANLQVNCYWCYPLYYSDNNSNARISFGQEGLCVVNYYAQAQLSLCTNY